MVNLFDLVKTPNGIGKVVGIKSLYTAFSINKEVIYITVWFEDNKDECFRWRTYNINNIKEIT